MAGIIPVRARAAVRVGISGWRYAPWRGVFYPAGVPQREELAYASRRLSTIEINGSFYSLQRPEHYARWYGESPPGFVFSVKGPRFITHMLKLKDAAAATAVHEVEVFGPAATIVPYRDEQDAFALIARGGGSLVASVYGEDRDFLARVVSAIGPSHGRLLMVDPAIAGAHTGHGIVMPQCHHGGPGRAGNGEELGGLHGLRLYHQRLAVQGSTDLLTELQAKAYALH